MKESLIQITFYTGMVKLIEMERWKCIYWRSTT